MRKLWKSHNKNVNADKLIPDSLCFVNYAYLNKKVLINNNNNSNKINNKIWIAT